MTGEQKYSEVLKALGELLQSKNTTITCNEITIKELKDALVAAEEQIDRQRLQIEDLDAALDAAMKGGV